MKNFRRACAGRRDVTLNLRSTYVLLDTMQTSNASLPGHRPHGRQRRRCRLAFGPFGHGLSSCAPTNSQASRRFPSDRSIDRSSRTCVAVMLRKSLQLRRPSNVDLRRRSRRRKEDREGAATRQRRQASKPDRSRRGSRQCDQAEDSDIQGDKGPASSSRVVCRAEEEGGIAMTGSVFASFGTGIVLRRASFSSSASSFCRGAGGSPLPSYSQQSIEKIEPCDRHSLRSWLHGGADHTSCGVVATCRVKSSRADPPSLSQ